MVLSDDWDIVDGMPRWVWRLDDELSKMPKVSSPSDLLERAQEVQERAHRARADYFPDWPKDKFERWLAPRLEECRRVRNITSVILDGRPVQVN